MEHGYRSAGFCGLREYKGQRVYPSAPDSETPGIPR
jgi:hypothetical protein